MIDPPPSPCTQICRIDSATDLCLGCYRTLDEIAEWSIMTAADKRVVLAQLPARRSVAG